MGIKIPTDDLVIENAELIYRNFSGSPTPFNANGGIRTFSIEIERPQAEALEALGWKVKWPTKPREDGEEGRIHLPVTVKYHPRLRPPIVRMITSRGITSIDEEGIDVFDYMAFKKVDVLLRPYHWKQPTGAEGVKNMCSSIYVTIKEDALQLKYADVPEIGSGDSQLAIESSDNWGTGPDEDILEEAPRVLTRGV